MYSAPSSTAPSPGPQIGQGPAFAPTTANGDSGPGWADKADYSEPIDARHFTTLVGRHLAFARRHGVSPAVILVALEALAAEREEAAAQDLQVLMDGLRSRLRSQLRRSDLVVQIGLRRLGVVLLDTVSEAVPALEARLGRALIQPDPSAQRRGPLGIRLGSAVDPGNYAEGDATQLVMAAELALRLPRASAIRQPASDPQPASLAAR